MYIEQLPLSEQLILVFQEIKPELAMLSTGTVFVQIRNNVIGKFGVRHFPFESSGVKFRGTQNGLSNQQQKLFRQLAIESLKYKHHWTHGEIQFDFTLRQQILNTSVQFESNYNMSNILSAMHQGNK